MLRTLVRDTEKCVTHVYTSFFQPLTRRKQLGNWPKTTSEVNEEDVGETTVNPESLRCPCKSKLVVSNGPWMVLFITPWEWFFLSLWKKSYAVTIQVKPNEQYFPLVLFIMLYKVVLTFESVDEILKCDHSVERYWALSCEILCFCLCCTKWFLCGYEILKCGHSNESYWAVLSCGTLYYAVQSGSNFWVCGWNPIVWPFNLR